MGEIFNKNDTVQGTDPKPLKAPSLDELQETFEELKAKLSKEEAERLRSNEFKGMGAAMVGGIVAGLISSGFIPEWGVMPEQEPKKEPEPAWRSLVIPGETYKDVFGVDPYTVEDLPEDERCEILEWCEVAAASFGVNHDCIEAMVNTSMAHKAVEDARG